MNKIPDTNSKNYIKLIIDCFKDFSQIQKIKTNEELVEYKLDVFSDKFYENLFKNFLYFYSINGTKKVDSDEQKYLTKEIVNILHIIYEGFPALFFDNDFLKSVLIYLIYSFKETPIINIEIVQKIFLGFYDLFPLESNKGINEEVIKFEADIVKSIKKLIIKFISNFEINVKIPKSENNFLNVICYLKPKVKSLPLYLKGFIDYNGLSQQKKFFIIKIYNYFKIINPFQEEDVYFDLYQGYILYEIISNKQSGSEIDFINYRKILKNRMKNNDAKNILKIAIQLLEKRYSENFNNELNKIDFDFENDNPQILDIFYDTENYYKDIFKQLRFYLTQYKTSDMKKTCKIVNDNLSRVLWLNFCKILLLNLSEDNIKEDNIKIIFYSIVHLFNPDIPNNSLEFCEDVIPKFFSQCQNFSELLNNQEIYKIIDDYEYYPNFSKNNTFTQTFINLLNKKIMEDVKVNELQKQKGINFEINNIKKCHDNIPFPLLLDYLKQKKLNPNESFSENSYLESNLYNFYKNCWLYLDEMGDIEKELFFENLRKILSAVNPNHIKDIKDIINEPSFLDLVYDIMISPVMKGAYNRIYYWYSTNGEYELDKEAIDDIKNIENFDNKSNLINNHPIIEYYNKFCEALKSKNIPALNNPNLFIVMGLPSSIKGFTFRFLKIVINSEGIQFPSYPNQEIDKEIKITLLKAYLVFVIIHEQNHFMKRYFNQKQANILCNTPVIKDIGEGGRQLIKLLFGDELIKKNLNIEQAKYILDINNWNKKSVFEFKKGFLEIKTGNYGDKCIVYLTSSDESICDHSKLHA